MENITIMATDPKSPGTGIAPNEIDNLVGMKARRDLEEDTLLKIEDLYGTESEN